MEKEEKILKIREMLIKHNIACSKLEYTTGNYDNRGNEILAKVPTITCDLGEIGTINDNIFLTIIFPKKSLSQLLFNMIKRYSDSNIYPYINFNETLYPPETNSLDYLKQRLKEEKYFQVNIEFKESIEKVMKEVIILKKSLENEKITYINQLADSLDI